MASEQNALMKWMSNNPEMTNMGMGFLKSLGEEQKNKGTAASEVAKTQYGYLLGHGPGDIAKAQGPGMLDRLAQGYITGRATRQGDEMNAKIMDLIGAKAKNEQAGATKKTYETAEQVLENENPHHRSAFVKGKPLSVEDAMKTQLARQMGVIDEAPTPALEGGLGLPDIMTKPLSLGLERSKTFRDKQEQDKQRQNIMRRPAGTIDLGY